MSQALSSKAVFDEAIELVNSGRADEAELICREAVERNPRDVNMTALLGAVLVKMNRAAEAEAFLRTAIRIAPTFAKPHEDLGSALLSLGRPEEAVECLKKATRLDPGLDSAFLNLGKALATLGRGQEADEAFEASFELNPQRKVLARAADHHKKGRLREAEHLYRQVLRENPRNVDALRLLAMLAFGSGRADDAERLLRRAIKFAPDFVGAVIDLGRVLKEQGRFKEAIECFEQAIRLEPNSVQAHFQLGGTLAPAGLTYDAIDAYRRAIDLNPRHPGALLGLGHVLKTAGRQTDAIAAYRECLRVKPDSGEIYWSLANLKTYRLSDEDMREMKAKLEHESLSEQSRVNLLFALAKAHEDRKDYPRAWKYYEEGNRTQRLREVYDPVKTEVMNDAIIEVFDAQFVAAKTGLGDPDPAPIFIMGLPRSGSTLIEQILASHPMVEGTSELPYLGRVATSLNRNRADGVNYPQAVRELGEEHLQALGRDYMEAAELHRTAGTPHFIDKMPNNFPTIGFLHLILPNAKIIDARRYPLDACLGCYRQLFARGQTFTYDLNDIGEYYLQYQRMMDHWEAVLPGRVLTVQYEEIVTDFENQVRRLIDYCGLPWEDACLRFYETNRPVRTASSEQVRQPVHSRAVNYWRHYEQHLAELIEVLAPVLERYRKYEAMNR